MEDRNSLRRGVALGVAILTGLSAAALSVVGISEHADRTAQRGVTLVSTADAAHNDLILAQAEQNDSLFNQDVALQQSIYSWALEPTTSGGLGLPDDSLLFPGDPADPADSLFNGAFSRFTEADLVGQALMQAQLDDVLGLNQTLGDGGYEAAIAASLYDNLSGAAIDPDSALYADLQFLAPDSDIFTAAGGFQDALGTLQGDLMQAAWADLFGIFSLADVTP